MCLERIYQYEGGDGVYRVDFRICLLLVVVVVVIVVAEEEGEVVEEGEEEPINNKMPSA